MATKAEKYTSTFMIEGKLTWLDGKCVEIVKHKNATELNYV